MPSPDLIVQRVMDLLAESPDPGQPPGQVILLHDAGGDRSQTVAALPRLIDALRAKGYQLVTIDQLAGMTRAQAMPPTSRIVAGAAGSTDWASASSATSTSC